jgi:hypothetical protein
MPISPGFETDQSAAADGLLDRAKLALADCTIARAG